MPSLHPQNAESRDYKGGVNALLGDEFVRFLQTSIPDLVRRALLSANGNDNDMLKDW